MKKRIVRLYSRRSFEPDAANVGKLAPIGARKHHLGRQKVKYDSTSSRFPSPASMPDQNSRRGPFSLFADRSYCWFPSFIR